MNKNEELKRAVLKEVEALKKHATPEQISELNLLEIDPNSSTNCIYGQMTGNCFSVETAELVRLCAMPYSDSISEFKSPVDKFNDPEVRSFTALEFYITFAEKSCLKKIVLFLQDELKKLTIKDL